MPGSGAGRLLWSEDGRLRSGWRILLFAGLLALLAMLGGTALALVRGIPEPLRAPLESGVMLAAAVAAGAVMLRRADGRRAGALGYHLRPAAVREAGEGLALGVVMLAVVVVALAAAGMLAFPPDEGAGLGRWAAWQLGALAWFALPAAAEEALFRGYAFQALVEGVGAVGATLGLSALFALAHAANPNVGAFALLNIFLAGVLLSLVYLRTRSLWTATGVHLGWNWAMAGAFDLPVSGLEIMDAPLYDAVERGPDWLTGGAFGPEGGLAGTAAFLLGTGLVLGLGTFRASRAARADDPLVEGRLAGWGTHRAAAPAGAGAVERGRDVVGQGTGKEET